MICLNSSDLGFESKRFLIDILPLASGSGRGSAYSSGSGPRKPKFCGS